MGKYAIKMPDIGEGIAEVELVTWRVQPGETVKEDQILADVMTDKATVEIPSPVAGKVASLGGEPGQLMAVGAHLIVLEVEGEGNFKEGDIPAAAPTPAEPSMAASKPAPLKSPAVALNDVSGTTPAPIAPGSVYNPARSSTGAGVPSTRVAGEKPLASPALRKRAWDLGVELQYVQGSGPAGRITQEDLERYLQSRTSPASAAARPGLSTRSGEEAFPVIGMRRKIAQKMQEAKRRIPHFSYVEEIDVTNLELSRAHLNERFGSTRTKLTLLPFIARATILALADFPQMNARFDDDAGVVTRYNPVHLGIATQTDTGLMVPVVRHAEALDMWAFSEEVTRLADASRQGKAAREELTGSTITISSLGPLGGIVTTPVINHPEVAIIGVNKIVERPAIQDGTIAVRRLMNLSSSFDHRVIDGMDAARFVQAVRSLLERPSLLLVD